LNPFHTVIKCLFRSTLILSSRLCLCLQRRLFPSDLRTKILYAFLISPMRATGLADLIIFIWSH
jgi:hypothetical protein